MRTRWFGAQHFRPNTHFAQGVVIMIHQELLLMNFQAFTLLKTLFPSWVTLSDALGPCAVCDTLAETSREDKRELRKKAEEEKVDL